MARLVDNLLAFRILSLLVKPFRETEAFKLGIVDENGKILKKAADLQTAEEKDAYNFLTRLVFNLKRILMKLPGGESRIKSIIAAYWLVKECYEKRISNSLMEERYMALLETLEKNKITLVEEEILVTKFFEDAANITGAAVSTNEPVINPKKKKKVIIDVSRRGPVVQ